MPLIYEVSCDQCDFTCESSNISNFVVLENDSEVICGHPLEDMIAKEVTGRDWDDLKRRGRLRNRRTYLCLGCAELGAYGLHRGHVEAILKRDIVRGDPGMGWISSEDIHKSAAYRCPSCGEKKLYDISESEDFLNELLRCLFGRYQERLTCPKCKTGHIKSEPIAIS